MTIFSVFVISKSGGLIYSHDTQTAGPEVEKTFSFPLDLRLDYINQRIVVTFGQRDGIRGQSCFCLRLLLLLTPMHSVGYSVLSVNGKVLNGRTVDGEDVLDDILMKESNYPISIK